MAKIYGLLTKREVKMAGYWPTSSFVCFRTESTYKSAVLIEQSWSITDLLYGK